MKLHLPLSLLSFVLAPFCVLSASAQEKTEGYILTLTQDVSDYQSNTSSDYHTFLVSAPLDFSPTTADWWNNNAPLISGGNITITSESTPQSLSFREGASQAFADVESLTFDSLSKLTFSDFSHTSSGGTITIKANGSLTISRVTDNDSDTTDIIFQNNKVEPNGSSYGGAIYAASGTQLNIVNNGSIAFIENSITAAYAADCGGAIYTGGDLTIDNNENVTFLANSSDDDGGAICTAGNLSITNNKTVTFSDNESPYRSGGAIYSTGAILIDWNKDVIFENNSAHQSAIRISSPDGGAICTMSSLTISNNNNVRFTDNYTSYNSITSGGALYVSTTLTIKGNENIDFIRNSTTVSGSYSCGGAITASTIDISKNADVSFIDNGIISTNAGYHKAKGGAISAGTTFTITENNDIIFSGNSISAESCYTAVGGAIYAGHNLIINTNEDVVFKNNIITSQSDYLTAGGAIYGTTSVDIQSNNSVLFEGNSISSSSATQGGAICANDIAIDGNGFVNFSSNKAISDAEALGGAIFNRGLGSVTNTNISDATSSISHNNEVLFDSNFSSLEGGALYNDFEAEMQINNNGTVLFANNEAGKNAGAIANNGSVHIDNNGQVTFSGNGITNAHSFDVGGGAIRTQEQFTIHNTVGNVTFSDNKVEGAFIHGGALATYNTTGTTSISQTGSNLTFENNQVALNSIYSDSSGDSTVLLVQGAGGAINNCNNLYIEDTRGNVTFNQNSVHTAENVNNADLSSSYAHGGAIRNISNLVLSGTEGEVNFTNNFAQNKQEARGGAIMQSSLHAGTSLVNNNNVQFKGNYVSAQDIAQGGAIYVCRGYLDIADNAQVIFEQNYTHHSTEGTYKLQSLYAVDTAADANAWISGYNDQKDYTTIHLGASENQQVEIRDSIYVHLANSKSSFSLNNARDNGELRTGDIIFTGATTEADLLAVKGSAGTAEEILASRTSEVYTMTNLYGGRLRIEDGAIYKGNGITVHEGAAATLLLKDGTLSHSGYDITISSGSTLSALGENVITASTLAIQEGGILQLALNNAQVDSAAVLTTTGTLNMGAIALNLTGTEYLVSGDYKLLTRTEGSNYDISGWTLNGVTSDELRWKNGTLFFTCGYDWNHGVTDQDDISDLEEIIGNLIINGGDVTLDDVVQAIQDAVDAGFGHGQGHIVINRGGIHISGAGDLDGHIIFNGDLKDIRKLFIEKDITVIKIELGGSSETENIVNVSDDQTLETGELSGEGGMKKNGNGRMRITGTNNQVGGTLAVQEGDIIMETGSQTDVHELTLGSDEDLDATVHVKKDAVVTGDTLQVDGANATLINEGCMNFSGEVKVTNGHLENNGSISKITLAGGTVSGSGIFNGLEMHDGELIVGNSPGLMSYTDALEMEGGEVVFSLADAAHAATAETAGWDAAAYSTIDMNGNALTIGGDVNFVLEIGGAALEALIAKDGAALTFSLQMIQNIHADSLTLNAETLAALLGNTTIIITEDSEGLLSSYLHLAGMDITSMLSNGEYSYEGNNLVFKGTITNDGSLTVPEPTTATLSLLALACLAARRRRK